jgi:hypothetical protein
MDVELTLTLDRDSLERAKRYAERHGLSLSEIVRNYFASLNLPESSPAEPTGVVAELAGLLRGEAIDSSKEDFADHLASKHS